MLSRSTQSQTGFLLRADRISLKPRTRQGSGSRHLEAEGEARESDRELPRGGGGGGKPPDKFRQQESSGQMGTKHFRGSRRLC